MNELVIDNKKYVLLAEEEFLKLQKEAAKNWKPEQEFIVDEARTHNLNAFANGPQKSSSKRICSRQHSLI